jgi:hypothetical protein
MINRRPPSKKSGVIVLAFMTISFVGISYFHYQDMVKPLPDFDSLRPIAADGMKYTVSTPPRSTQSVFEFTDKNGKRFQTKYMEAKQAQAIQDALRQKPVTLFVGRWKSALESDSIFTVYHMSANNEILVSYEEMAEAKKKEQDGAIPVIAFSLSVMVGIAAFVYKKSMKQQLQ